MITYGQTVKPKHPFWNVWRLVTNIYQNDSKHPSITSRTLVGNPLRITELFVYFLFVNIFLLLSQIRSFLQARSDSRTVSISDEKRGFLSLFLKKIIYPRDRQTVSETRGKYYSHKKQTLTIYEHRLSSLSRHRRFPQFCLFSGIPHRGIDVLAKVTNPVFSGQDTNFSIRGRTINFVWVIVCAQEFIKYKKRKVHYSART